MGAKEEAKALNSYLDTLRPKVYEAKRKMLESDKLVTAEALKKVLAGNDENRKMVTEAHGLLRQKATSACM